MPTQIDPSNRELVWATTRATGVVTDIFVTEMYDQLLFQIIDTGTPSWTIQFQTCLGNATDQTTDGNWQPAACIFGTTTVNLTAVGVYVPIASGIIVPRVRAKLTNYVSGTPRPIVCARYRQR